jgi:hypothetical protein
MLLLTINEAYDRRTLDTLAALKNVGSMHVSGDGLLSMAGLVAAGLINVQEWGRKEYSSRQGFQSPMYIVTLTERGNMLLDAWAAGDQAAAVAATSYT